MKSKIVYHCSKCNEVKEVKIESSKVFTTPYCDDCEIRMVRTVL